MNESIRTKIVEMGNVSILSDHALVNGQMRNYIKTRFPGATGKRDTNFSVGAEGQVIRFRIKGFIVLYLRNWLEVVDLELVRKQVERVADWVRLIDDNVMLTIKREAKNG